MATNERRPWMTAIEMQFAAIKAVDAKGKGYGDLTDAVTVQHLLRHAETYAWSSETSAAVWLASKTIPGTASLQHTLMPSAYGWWWFDTPLSILGGDYCAFVFGDGDDGQVWFQSFLTTNNGTMRPSISWSFIIGEGHTIDDFLASVSRDGHKQHAHITVSLLRVFIAGCLWLRQRVVMSSLGHIERHRRKQLARENNAPLPSDVKVIQLRRAESEHTERTAGSDQVDWSCRWIVNGHWRNQPYKDDHKLIYIMPFVKGPEDKPLRVPTHTVYQVNR